jgi:ketosteroid isomerase-like protein
MKSLIALLATLLAVPAVAADRAAEVRAAEIGFAKAFADRDAVMFASFVADGANFLQRKRTLAGKDEVMKVWGEMLKQPKAPFSWSPIAWS